MKHLKPILFLLLILIIPVKLYAAEDPYCIIKVTNSWTSKTARLDWDCEDLSYISSFTVYESNSSGQALSKVQKKNVLTNQKKGSWEIPSNGKKLENNKMYLVSVMTNRNETAADGTVTSSKKVQNVRLDFKAEPMGPANPSAPTTTKSVLTPNTTTRQTTTAGVTSQQNNQINYEDEEEWEDVTIGESSNFLCDEGDYLLDENGQTMYEKDKDGNLKTDENGNTIKKLSFKGFINKYWSWVWILVPAALLILLSIDFAKPIISDDSDALKKNATNAIKRTIAALLILLTPTIVNLFMGWFGLTFCF